ncbi:MAG TPA: MrtC family glutamic-type intramembrane protease [Polyangiales bacterium]|nr:MrtC family glutamic-type intramembrane protease [Polyangiales bacterium]
MSPRPIARELALVYAAAAAVTLFVSHTPGVLVAMYGHLLLAGAFLWLALHMARREGESARRYGIDLAGLLEGDAALASTIVKALPTMLRELGVALLVACVVFPPFVLAFWLWHQPPHPFTFHPPSDPLDFVLTHLIAIALPEEALFRGYFQTRLSDLWPVRIRVLGAELNPRALVWQAGLFALLHFLVGFSPLRLAVFFPGLLFGWLRARRDGIGAAVWFHAFCNLLAEVLSRGYL